MRRKSLLMVLLALGITGTAFAAPLSNYDSGSVAVDLGFTFSRDVTGEVSVDAPGMGSGSLSTLPNIGTQTAWNAGVTAGIGGKVAIRGGYDHTRLGTGKISIPAESLNAELKLAESVINVDALYKINDNISPYIGWGRGKLKADLSGVSVPGGFNDSITSNFLRVGVVAQAPLSEKATVWTDLGVGTKSFQQMEVGLGYKVAKNVDFNVGYRYRQIKYGTSGGELAPVLAGSPYAAISADAKVKSKGWFAGLTYNF